MSNPYFITEPACISFSGGRTSAFMLYKVLEAHDGVLPDFVSVCFSNTGKEMPETLDFIRDCGLAWDVPIVWLEARIGLAGADEKNKYKYETVIVDHETASRNGEPFAQLIEVRQYLPNPVARFCTAELKVRRIQDYMESIGHKENVQLIGIRYDEPTRAAKMHNKVNDGHECYCPLFEDRITVEDISAFWNKSNFDLRLENVNGVCSFGNCDCCFLKGYKKKLSIISARPDLADWWIEQEKRVFGKSGTGSFFRSDQPNYAELKAFATEQGQLFDFEDVDSGSCFCGD